MIQSGFLWKQVSSTENGVYYCNGKLMLGSVSMPTVRVVRLISLMLRKQIIRDDLVLEMVGV